jgi:D-tyrosyl-tRNA(Tyr) deacylase
MRVVVQRVNKSSVTVDGKVVGKIDKGFTLLVGFTQGDTIEDIKYMVKKIVNLRIMDDENGVMNKSILDAGGDILSISQFTLYGDAKKGNRPSYIKALGGAEASPMYVQFNEMLREHVKVETGIFGADMKVMIENDGPVTILLETNEGNN